MPPCMLSNLEYTPGCVHPCVGYVLQKTGRMSGLVVKEAASVRWMMSELKSLE